MDKARRGPRRNESRATLVLALLAAQLLVAAVVYFMFRSRHGSPTATDVLVESDGSKDGLLAEGKRLQQQYGSWQRRALAAGLSVDHSVLQAQQQQPSTSRTAAVTPAADGSCAPNGHPFTTVVPDKFMMRPADEVAKENPDLAELLPMHANDKREIMLTFANAVMICKNATVCWWSGGNILESFLEILERSNVTNHIIGVTDEETAGYLAERKANRSASAFQVNWFRPKVKIPEVQANTREANRVSSLKFSLLQAMLQMGYHVMISDMDLVYMSNPFDHLHRDADIESSSDGYDNTAYGTMDSIHDPTMGWGGGGLFMRTFTINVGCAYIRATHRAFAVVKRAADQLGKEPGWDQQVFNSHLLTLSHGDYASTYATLRIMDITEFVNSKAFFRSHRSQYIPGASSKMPTPVMVHFNYHPDKHARMLCIMDRYFHGKLDACDKFPGGSEPNT